MEYTVRLMKLALTILISLLLFQTCNALEITGDVYLTEPIHVRHEDVYIHDANISGDADTYICFRARLVAGWRLWKIGRFASLGTSRIITFHNLYWIYFPMLIFSHFYLFQTLFFSETLARKFLFIMHDK